MALDLVYKVFEAFVLWRKSNDDWFLNRAAKRKEEADAEAAAEAAREAAERVPDER